MTNDTILVIDDNKTFCDYLCNILDAKGFCTKKAYSYRTATELIRNAQAEDVVLCDLQLGDNKTGNDLLKWMNENGFNNPFIIMTQYDQAVTAVEAMKLGAENYIPKELLFDKLYPQIEEIIRHRELLRKKEGNIRERKSKAFQEVYRRVFLCAPTDLTVLILGANGTGKEHVAHRIQAKSNRANKPYISVDCGTLGKELAASALFGYKKGAFTGAECNKEGYFGAANGGTLFLDEVGNLPIEVQQMLLRVLTTKTYHPIGSTEEKIADVRVIAATNENLEDAIKEKRFRQDLYYRLGEFTIQLPELGSCKEDILPLAEAFMEEANARTNKNVAAIDDGARKILQAYSWPGNVRELKHVIQQAVLLSTDDTITEELLTLSCDGTNSPGSLKELKDGIEKEHYEKMLEECGGNVTSTAKSIGISRSTIYRKMKSHGIKRKKK